MRVRKARLAEAEELTRIAQAAKAHWGYSARLMRLWEGDLTVTPALLREHPTYCAVDGGRIAGFYAVSGEHASRELEHMWVDPKRIGTGVGRLLFAHLVRHLRRHGVARLMIASDPHAEGFYRQLGARRIGTVAAKPAGRRLPRLVFDVP